MSLYQSLNTHRNEVRLITILPQAFTTSRRAPVECRLQTYCLDDEHLTLAYKEYLRDPVAPNVWDNPKLQARKISPGEELGEWIHLEDPCEDATISLPEFRYVWGDFLALSYTWGDPSISREIIVNGIPLMVTQNVEACLRELRSKHYIQKGWKLWIDAICINQEDIIERASQVPRMREIYTKAWTPIIWLGEQTEDSDDALDLLVTLARDYSSRDGVNRLTNVLQHNAEHFGKGRWRALNSIICRRYWGRLWIIQEAALGRKTMPVLCGGRTLAWSYFSLAFRLLNNTDEVINTYITNELKDVNLSFDYQLWANLNTVNEIQVLQDDHMNRRRSGMYRQLELSRTVSATDPRDKVYGLLGLMDESVAGLIKPDYTSTVAGVYRSFALAVIKGTGSLDTLRHCPSTDRSLFPSWVPDWRPMQAATPLTISDTAFNTSRSSAAIVHPIDNSQLLCCKGFILDRIDGMGNMWAKAWSPEFIAQSRGTANAYGTFEASRAAIWKSLVACNRITSVPLTPDLEKDFALLLATPAIAMLDLPVGSPLRTLVKSNVFKWCVDSLKGGADFIVAGRCIEEYLQKEVEPKDIDVVNLRDALMQRDRVGLYRRLITTERGYVGMALDTVEQGDAVAVILGCSMPMVLRKQAGQTSGNVRWRIIGECYVHGIMNGEAMGLGVEIQDIILS